MANMCLVDATPEELALSLSRASVAAQEQTEGQIREKATAVLAAASIVVPVVALVVGHGPSVVAIPFGVAAGAYALCVRECGFALLPRGIFGGLLGSELLEAIRNLDGDLSQMQETAARYLDREHRQNRENLEMAARSVRRAILMLTGEVVSLVVALLITLMH
jgi:uncharacterized membrane protein